MQRTQIFLPEEYHLQLKMLASKLHLSKGAVIRLMLEKGLKQKEEFLGGGNDLGKLSKLKIKGGGKDLSQNLDRYLYG